jgi:hypothetical protein
MSPGSTDLHTISFGPTNGEDAYLDQLAEGFIAPAPGGGDGPPTLVFDPRAGYPSEDPAAGVPAYTGSNHGNGFHNTGILDRDAASPLPASTRVTFTTPGKFTYICLIHPFMKDTVTVTP